MILPILHFVQICATFNHFAKFAQNIQFNDIILAVLKNMLNVYIFFSKDITIYSLNKCDFSSEATL